MHVGRVCIPRGAVSGEERRTLGWQASRSDRRRPLPCPCLPPHLRLAVAPPIRRPSSYPLRRLRPAGSARLDRPDFGSLCAGAITGAPGGPRTRTAQTTAPRCSSPGFRSARCRAKAPRWLRAGGAVGCPRSEGHCPSRGAVFFEPPSPITGRWPEAHSRPPREGGEPRRTRRKDLAEALRCGTLPAFRLHSWLCWLSSLGLSNYLVVPPCPEASPERTGACDRWVVRPDAAAPTPARLRKTLHHGPGVASMGAEPTGVKAGGIGRRNGRRRGGFLLGPTSNPVVPFNPDAAPSRCPPAGRSRRTGAVGRSSVSGGRPARSGRAGHSRSRR